MAGKEEEKRVREAFKKKKWNEIKTNDSWAIFKIMAEFVEAFDKLSVIGPCVSIFGSARTPQDNKYYLFGKDGGKSLAEKYKVPFLGEVPLVQSIREAGDYGRPAAMQTGTILETVFEELARSVVAETVKRNETLPATEAIKITTMAGCSAVKK